MKLLHVVSSLQQPLPYRSHSRLQLPHNSTLHTQRLLSCTVSTLMSTKPSALFLLYYAINTRSSIPAVDFTFQLHPCLHLLHMELIWTQRPLSFSPMLYTSPSAFLNNQLTFFTCIIAKNSRQPLFIYSFLL